MLAPQRVLYMILFNVLVSISACPYMPTNSRHRGNLTPKNGENHIHSLRRLAQHLRTLPLVPHGGSLLGLWYNNDVLPWDDDLDFGLLVNNEDLFLASMPPRITQHTAKHIMGDKLYTQLIGTHIYWANDKVVFYLDKTHRHHIKYRCYERINWFYADIIVYNRHNNHVVTDYYLPNSNVIRWGAHKWPSAWIFPLKHCTLANTSFMCPVQMEKVLLHEYGKGALSSSFQKYQFQNRCWRFAI